MDFKKPIDTDEGKLSDRLDLLKYMSDIHGRLRKDITTDYSYARLQPKDKEAVIEMTTNAYMVKKIINTLKESYNNTRKKWNHNKQKWEKEPLTREEINDYNNIANSIFDSIMTRVHMTVIMNRNVDSNHIMKMLSKYDEEEQTTEEEEQKESTINKIFKNMIKRNTRKDKEEE